MVVSFFMPDAVDGGQRFARQARMFIMSHLVGPILAGPAILALYLYDPTPGPDLVILAVTVTAFWIFPFLVRGGFSLKALIFASLALVHFGIFWSCFFYNGVASPTIVWMLIVPILGACYLGGDRDLQPFLAVLSASSVALFFLAYAIFDPDPNDVPSAAMLGMGSVNTIGVLCYVAFMAVYYARIFDAGVELEVEVERRRELAEELREAVVEADQASATKSGFLARMSHELRNPLHSILGYGQLLKEEAIERGDGQFHCDTVRILNAGFHLIRLIDMILNLSKLEAGRMKFDFQQHCVITVVLNVVERHRSSLEAGGNSVEIDLDPKLGMAKWDASRVGEVLGCLLSNASQHTRDGIIAVSGRRDDADPSMIRMVVSDTGCGMSPDLLSALFRTFPVKEEYAEQLKGTGLHLAIVGRLCAAMGGKITARSVLGRGSTFTVILPVESDADVREV